MNGRQGGYHGPGSRAHHSMRAEQDPTPLLQDIGITRGMTVADLGCGYGFYTLPLSSITGNTGLVYAVDSSRYSLEDLSENLGRNMSLNGKYSKITALERDISDTGIAESSVDVAFFANVFHDVEDKKKFIGEVKRILKPAGIAVDLDWHNGRTEFGPPMGLRVPEEEAKRMFLSNGMKLQRSIKVAPYHYCLVFSKA